MATEFKLPNLGEGIKSADIASLLVNVGDVIAAEQNVFEVETDKAVIELPCPIAGRVTKIHVKPGDKVLVGGLLLTIDETVTAGSGGATAPASGGAQAPSASKPATPAPRAEPAPAPVPARPAAAPAAVATPSTTVVAASVASAAPAPEGNGTPPPAGPTTRRLARELGVDLHLVTGTGPGGRITPEDVQSYIKARLAAASQPSAEAGRPVAPPLPDFAQWGPVERVAQNKLMRVSATNLSLAWQLIPHVTQHELADITELESARKRYIQAHTGKDGKEGSPKITMTVLAMKALVTALKAFPMFNSSYDMASGEVVVKKYYNIGVAVDTEQGLLVPVIRDVEGKSVLQLAAELNDMALRARQRKLSLAEMQGGTFTITNLGGIGGTAFTPIVNHPEVAILGMSRSSQQYVIVDGQPQVRLMLPLSLSYDHRVVNGADGARFIVKVASLLSDPFQLLSEV